jgi:hypothetical protein
MIEKDSLKSWLEDDEGEITHRMLKEAEKIYNFLELSNFTRSSQENIWYTRKYCYGYQEIMYSMTRSHRYGAYFILYVRESYSGGMVTKPGTETVFEGYFRTCEELEIILNSLRRINEFEENKMSKNLESK